MTLLPDVERELARVAARRPPRHRGSRADRPGSGAASGRLLAAAVVLVAVVLGVGFVGALRHRGAGSAPGGSPSPSSTPRGGRGSPRAHRAPVAPSTQRGTWEGGDNSCPLAPPERGLPARSGCVSVVHADVTGAGGRQPVVLSATLTHHAAGAQYTPRQFVLRVIEPDGRTISTVIPHGGYSTNAFLARVGNVNERPGAELFVEVLRISSGSTYLLYTWRDGHLVRQPVTLAAGGDSGAEAGFSCRVGPDANLVQRFAVLGRGGLSGPWRWTATTYTWQGSTLHRSGRRTYVRRGIPSAEATTDGAGCGRAVGSGPTSIRR